MLMSMQGDSGTRTLGHLRHSGTRALGHLATCGYLGHSGTWAIRHLGTRGTLFSRLSRVYFIFFFSKSWLYR